MLRGTLQQVDTPEYVYSRPANRFVAGFIGSPAMNMVEARLTQDNGVHTVSFGDHRLALDDELLAARPGILEYEDSTVVLGIRPEDFEDAEFVPGAPPERTITTVCTLREALGSEVLLHFAPVRTNGSIASLEDTSAAFVARVDPETAVREDSPVRLVVDTRRLHFFDSETGLAVYGEGARSHVATAAS
jgi:multiple sugar transport system ATP-binding protein